MRRGRHEACGFRKRIDSNPCPLPSGHTPFSLIVHHHIDCYGYRPGGIVPRLRRVWLKPGETARRIR